MNALEGADFSLHLLGGCRLVTHDGRELTPRGRKARCILGLLAMAPDGTVGRERLTGLLWSDRAEDQARASFRQCLAELRRDLGTAWDLIVASDRQRVGLVPGAVQIDARAVLEAATRHDLERAIACTELWRGDLLADIGSVDTVFDEWLHIEREQLRSRLVELVRAATLGARERGAPELFKLLSALLRLDPVSEEAYRILIEETARRGERAAALQHYDHLRAVLARDLRTRPSAALERLVEDVRVGRLERPEPGPLLRTATADDHGRRLSRPVTGPPVIMVLPFANLGGDPTQDLLCDGLTDDVITSLARFRELAVVSRRPSFAHRGHETDPEALGRLSGVDYLLEGSVRRFAEVFRINVQLSSTDRHQQIWSTRYEIEAAELRSLLDDVARRILGAVLPAVEADRLQLARRKAETDHQAYDLYLQAKHMLYVAPRPGQGFEIVRLLERAIELDPDFALAHFQLVRLYNTNIGYTAIGRSIAADRQRALDLARRGLELDPQNAYAHVCMGWCHLWRGEWRPATYHLDRVLDLNPFDPHRLTDIATALMFLGETDRAIRYMEEAFRLNPHHPEQYFADLGEIRLVRGELDVAWSLFSQEKLGTPYRLGWHTACAGLAGKGAEAERIARQFVESVQSAWVGSAPCRPADCVEWFRRFLPFRHEEPLARLLDGLKAAGLNL